MAVSEDIESVSYLVPLQWYFHSYFYPFVIVYIIECLIWYTCLTSEGAFGLFILTVFFQFVLVLSCVWSVHAKAFLTYKKVINLSVIVESTYCILFMCLGTGMTWINEY